ncbi:MAG: hypothetical protein HY791_22450 [Deltaproteobacteria bacterium]|nr:hypothetical protein [Deltaproteobacteria bacterium]
MKIASSKVPSQLVVNQWDILVNVEAGAGEQIKRVRVVLNGIQLEDADLDEPTAYYSSQFNDRGSASTNRLVVTAFDVKGVQTRAENRWS